MKNFILRSALMLAMSISIFSCSSDSDSDPAPQECPAGFTGINCQTQITPSKIKITKFRVTFFNNQDNGASWDTGSGPDIFLQLVNGAGGAISGSARYIILMYSVPEATVLSLYLIRQ